MKYDVVFTAAGELNADDNWEIVKLRYPDAHRIDDMPSIYEAYKAASEVATEDSVLIIDGDNTLLGDKLDIDTAVESGDYELNRVIKNFLSEDFVIVWNSCNNANTNIYGHGGLKLFKTKSLQRGYTGADITNGVGSRIMISSQIASLHAFDFSEWNAWKTGYREGAKLFYAKDVLGKQWLYAWTHEHFGKYGYACEAGACMGATFAKNNSKGTLVMINLTEFLELEFKKWVGSGRQIVEFKV